MTDEERRGFLIEEARVATCAVTRKDGRSHATPSRASCSCESADEDRGGEPGRGLTLVRLGHRLREQALDLLELSSNRRLHAFQAGSGAVDRVLRAREL